MKAIYQIIKEQEENFKKIESLNLQIKKLNIKIKTEIEQISQNYSSIKINIDNFLSSINSIIKQLTKDYPENVQLIDNKLYCTNMTSEYYSFDENNYLDIFQSAKNKLINGLKQIYVNFNLNTLIDICKQYNTILNLQLNIENLKLIHIAKISKKLQNDAKNIEIELNKLQKININLKKEIELRIKN